MKITEGKHNHSLTNILKVILFSFIMLLPVGAIASKSLYVICNKNAKDSYYGETINQEIKTYFNIDELEENKQYSITTTNLGNSTLTSSEYVNIFVSNVEDSSGNYDISETNMIRILTRANSYTTLYCYNGQTEIKQYDLYSSADNSTITFKYYSKERTNTFIDNKELFYIISYNKYSYLDNAFYYAIDQIKEETIFNWTKNTAIYSGINTMNINLGINNEAISIILTYWLLMTAIYVIIDIVITAFTLLTHIFSKKAE